MITSIKITRDLFLKQNPTDFQSVEKIRVDFLGRNGYLTKLFDDFKSLPNEQKKRGRETT